MTVHIYPCNDSVQYFVNGKAVWKDTDGDWIAKPELNPVEKQFFAEYLKMTENVKRELTATFKI